MRMVVVFLAVFLAVLFCLASGSMLLARDLDGRYAGSPLKGWFDGLKSSSGALCCSDADGFAISDPDWDSKDGHYRVRLNGDWMTVPDDAVINEPNRAGRAMVWPVKGSIGISIRCFIPGALG
jgi:hypothetical protein